MVASRAIMIKMLRMKGMFDPALAAVAGEVMGEVALEVGVPVWGEWAVSKVLAEDELDFDEWPASSGLIDPFSLVSGSRASAMASAER